MELNKKKTIIISILILVALLVTADLAYIYYEANFNGLYLGSFCSVNSFIDCDGIARTPHSQFLGVPLAYWGIFLYSFICMLLAVDKLKQFRLLKFLEVFKNKFHYIASLGLISFCISMSLLALSLFEIKKLCIMCAITYVLNLIIGLVACQGIENSFWGAIKQSFIDFKDALKPMGYRIAFIVVMILATAFLGWTFATAKFSPALKSTRNFGEFIKAKTNKYAVKGNVLGSDAKDAVVLEVYSDYMCPMCSVNNIMIHKLVTEYTNLRVEHHSMPLDNVCNTYLGGREFHVGSCTMAQYAEAAQEQGKFWEVNSLFFDKKPETEDEVIKVLEESGFDLDMDKLKADAHSKKIAKQITDDIDYAVKRNSLGTPILKIGDYFEMGVIGYYELKELVEKNGAIAKHNKNIFIK